VKHRFWIALLSTAILGLSVVSFAEQFRHPVYYKTGPNTSPHYAIAVDLRDNGLTDVVTADYPGSYVTVLLGNNDGTFLKAQRIVVPNAYWIAAGDFNEDGKLDLVVLETARGTGVLQILLGDGTGKFQFGPSYNTGVTPISVAAADFDGDGHLDLAEANEAGFKDAGSVMVFRGTGKETFKKPATYKVDYSPWAITAGDLNGDGHPDLAVTNIAGFVSVLMNDDTGKFGKPVNYDAGGGETTDVKIADLNHDGYADLAAADLSLSKIAVLLNKGDGTFGKTSLYTTVLPNQDNGADGLVIADFNLDGNLDIAAANLNGNSALLYGDGTGKFRAPVPIHDRIKFAGASSIASGDLNNDGAPDLAIPIQNDGKVAIMINTQ
jgi:hypothetical protein